MSELAWVLAGIVVILFMLSESPKVGAYVLIAVVLAMLVRGFKTRALKGG